MSLSFTCPYCRMVSQIDAAHLGKAGPCPGCGKSVTVPIPKEARLSAAREAGGSLASRLVAWAGVFFAVAFIVGAMFCVFIVIKRIQSREMQNSQPGTRLNTDRNNDPAGAD